MFRCLPLSRNTSPASAFTRPDEKSHSTALDAGRNAHELRAKNLILYHTEDRTLETRRERYAAEVRGDGRRLARPDT